MDTIEFNFQLFDFLFIILTVLLLLDIRRKLQKSELPQKNPLVLDSSVLIDGRILEIIRSGFISGRIIIPKFILQEMQLLADGTDSHKRERARFGLDIANELANGSHEVKTIIDRYLEQSALPNDERLLLLCKKRKAKLCTIDFNLNKVATVEKLTVLNINELAQSLRQRVLAGEVYRVKLLQKGETRDQAVGYSDDGTMIVVEKGASKIGKVVDVRVERTLQTVAGRMIFANLVAKKQGIEPRHR